MEFDNLMINGNLHVTGDINTPWTPITEYYDDWTPYGNGYESPAYKLHNGVLLFKGMMVFPNLLTTGAKTAFSTPYHVSISSMTRSLLSDNVYIRTDYYDNKFRVWCATTGSVWVALDGLSVIPDYI